MANTKSIKGTQTEQLIVNSYLAEAQAFARYMFYAKIADQELYFPVGVIMREAAYNEAHHAKVFMKYLGNNHVVSSCNVDAGFLGDTVSNLHTAIKEESVDGYEYYLNAAKVATSEGFSLVARTFEAFAAVEKSHHDRFSGILNHINSGTLWNRADPVTWKCLVCGYTLVGTRPPVSCPGCDHEYQHFIALEDGFAPYSRL